MVIETTGPHHSWHRLKFWDYYFKEVQPYLSMRTRAGAHILPDTSQIFRALELGLDDVKVVILGQDPYHTKGLAHGLAFSIPYHVKNYPPTLRNILDEYVDDLGFDRPRFGNLTPWAEKGVLLLNTSLTVEAGKPNSHASIGWERLIFEVITKLSERKDPVAFMLWGKKAQEYAGAIRGDHHVIQQSPHPSPLSRGFKGSKPFSTVCKGLGISTEFWRLP